MRTITTCLALAMALIAAIALDAPNLVTTMITIPLGALVGFSFVVSVVSKFEPRERRRTPRAAAAGVIVLHPRRAPAPALPAPDGYRLAA